jgi:hypothetical protein
MPCPRSSFGIRLHRMRIVARIDGDDAVILLIG